MKNEMPIGSKICSVTWSPRPSARECARSLAPTQGEVRVLEVREHPEVLADPASTSKSAATLPPRHFACVCSTPQREHPIGDRREEDDEHEASGPPQA